MKTRRAYSSIPSLGLAMGFGLLVGCAADTGSVDSAETTQDASQLLGHEAASVAHHARLSQGSGHRHWRSHRGHSTEGGGGASNGSGASSNGNPSTGGVATGTGGSSTSSAAAPSTPGDEGMGGAIVVGPGATGGASNGGDWGGLGGSYGGPAVCGDAIVQWWAESCDDGNTVAGDGCDANCLVEPNFVCEGMGEPCRPVLCGDGYQDWYPVEGAGGSLGMGGSFGTAGSVGVGAVDEAAGAAPMPPDATGGSGGATFVSYGYEACDDGNTDAGDGCDGSCNLEPGYICDAPGEPCRTVSCGDGLQDYYSIDGVYYWESCDDGNIDSGDGCSSDCQVEVGYVCDGPGLPCRQPVCGDGVQDWYASEGSGAGGASGVGGASGMGGTVPATGGAGGAGAIDPYGSYEACDDGNVDAGDGCSPTCEVEAGWACWWQGEPCHLIVCGDGLMDWPDEECDDGNDTAGDGCDACRWEGFAGTGGSGGYEVGGAAGASVVIGAGGTVALVPGAGGSAG